MCGRGRQRIAMSQRMLGTAMQSWARNKSMQYPSTQGSQILFLGLHWKAAAKMQAKFQAVVNPPHM